MGKEKYKILKDGTIRKVKNDGDVDMDGLEYNVIEEQKQGYQVYVTAEDPSQPTPIYFISKKHFVKE